MFEKFFNKKKMNKPQTLINEIAIAFGLILPLRVLQIRDTKACGTTNTSISASPTVCSRSGSAIYYSDMVVRKKNDDKLSYLDVFDEFLIGKHNDRFS